MKKVTLYLPALFAFLCQSCTILNSFTEASFDLSRARSKSQVNAPYAPFESDAVGFNVGAIFLTNLSPPKPTGMLRQESLLASTDRSTLFPTTAPPQLPSFFTSEHYALLTGVELIMKGDRIKDDDGKAITRLWYLEVPIIALYRHQFGNQSELFGGFGPYLAFGVAGSSKETFRGQAFDYPVFGKEGRFSRFDAGLALTAGYQLPNALRLRLGYDLGLANITPGSGGIKTRNRTLSLNVGFPLDKLIGKLKKR